MKKGYKKGRGKKTSKARQKEKTSPGFKFENISERQKDLLVFGLLLILLFTFFNEFIFENKTVKAGDTIASFPLTKWGSEQTQFIPGWIPNLFGGMPSYGSFVFTPSYPVSLTVGLFSKYISDKLADNITRFIIHLLFAGISMFYFMRSRKLDRFSSFVSACTFIFTCHFIGLINGGHTIKLWTICYIPLMFLLIDKVIEKPSLRSTIVAGLVFGLMLTARHVQIVYYFLLAIALFVLFMLGWEFQESKKIKPIIVKLFCFGSVISTGFLLAAFLYIPIYEYSAYSIRGGGGVSYDYATSWSFHPFEMTTFLIPSFFGFGGQTYWGGMPFTDSPMYMGLLPIVFTCIALVYRRNKYTIFFGILALSFLILSLGKHLPLLYSILYKALPFFNKFRAPVMMQLMTEFSVAILAGFGVNTLIKKYKSADLNKHFEKIKKNLTRISIFLAVLFIVVLVTQDKLFSILSSNGMFERGQEASTYNAQTLSGLKELRFDLFVKDFYKMVLLFAAIIAVTILLFRKRISLSLSLSLLSIILITDLWLVNSKIIKLEKGLDLEKMFVSNSTVAYLQEDPDIFRIFPVSQLFGRNEWIYYNLQTIGGYHPAKLKIYNEILQSCLYSPNAAFPINMNLVNLLNVKYLVVPGKIDHPDLELAHFDKSSGYLIYQNKTVFPRAYLIDSVKVIQDKQEIFSLLNSKSFNPQKIAIMEKEPSAPLTRNESATVSITNYSIHEIELKTSNLEHPSLLFLSEIYYPAGWHAYVDGQETEIYKTNYIFRSILVPSGEHQVQFVFKPQSSKIGFWISSTTFFVCVIGFIFGKRIERKKDTN